MVEGLPGVHGAGAAGVSESVGGLGPGAHADGGEAATASQAPAEQRVTPPKKRPPPPSREDIVPALTEDETKTIPSPWNNVLNASLPSSKRKSDVLKGPYRVFHELDPKAKLSQREDLSDLIGENKVCCLFCLKFKPNTSPVMILKGGTSNLLRHLREKHKEQNDAREKAIMAAAATSTGKSKAAPLAQPKVTQSYSHVTAAVTRVEVRFTTAQIQRAFSASLIMNMRPFNLRNDRWLRTALYMASGGKVDLPDVRTIDGHMQGFEQQMRVNLSKAFEKIGLLTVNGEPVESPLPLLSIAFDATTTKNQGQRYVSLRGSALDSKFRLRHFALACGAFELEVDGEEGAFDDEEKKGRFAKMNQRNLAKFIVKVLTEHKLIPPVSKERARDLLSYDISEYVFATTSDNGRPEVACVTKQLKTLLHTSPVHGMDLVIKKTLKEASGTSGIMVVLDILAKAAKNFKKGLAGISLQNSQLRDGVDKPRSLKRRVATRWSMAQQQLLSGALVRQWLPAALGVGNQPSISDGQWTDALHALSVFTVIKDAVDAMQDPELLIGDHFFSLVSMLHKLREKDKLEVLPDDFAPSAEQLNMMSRSHDKWHWRDEMAVPSDNLSDGAYCLVTDLATGFNSRFANGQLASMPSMLACALHPTNNLKKRIYKINYVGNPFSAKQQHETVAKLRELVDTVTERLNTKEQGAVTPLAAGAAAGGEERPSKTRRLNKSGDSRPFAASHDAFATSDEDEEEPEDVVNAWLNTSVPKGSDGAAPSIADFWAPIYSNPSHRFHALAHVARSVFGTMADSVLEESDFSKLAAIVTPQRSLLSDDKVERCLKLIINHRHWSPVPECKDDTALMEYLSKIGAVPDDSDSDEDLSDSEDEDSA